MALNNSATLNVDNLAAYVNTSGTAAPSADLTPAALATFDFDAASLTGGWSLLGHTSSGTDVTVSAEIEGGETLSSLQRAALRRTPIRATFSIGIALLQFDNTALSLYFGGGDTTQPNFFGIPKQFTVAERSIVLVMGDAEANLAWHFEKVQLSPEGDISFGPSALSEMGLSISILDSDTASDLGGIFRAGLGTPV